MPKQIQYLYINPATSLSSQTISVPRFFFRPSIRLVTQHILLKHFISKRSYFVFPIHPYTSSSRFIRQHSRYYYFIKLLFISKLTLKTRHLHGIKISTTSSHCQPWNNYWHSFHPVKSVTLFVKILCRRQNPSNYSRDLQYLPLELYLHSVISIS